VFFIGVPDLKNGIPNCVPFYSSNLKYNKNSVITEVLILLTLF